MKKEYSYELYHYGISGQKWGIRRFQNEDGTYTPAGRERYGYGPKGNSVITGGNRNESNGFRTAFKRGAVAGIGAKKTVFEKAEEDYNRKNKQAQSKADRGKMTNELLTQRKKGKDKPPSSPAEDIMREGTKGLDGAEHFARTADKVSKQNKKKNSPDLSNMSDEEIRQKINRMNLERQYNELTQKDTTSGWERTADILSMAKDVVIIGGTIVTIAATVHKLKNG